MPGHKFYQVNMAEQKTCITNPCKYDSDHYFTTGVIKIQDREEHLLTPRERNAVTHLLKPDNASNPSPPSPARPSKKPPSSVLEMARAAKKEKESIKKENSAYDDVAHHCVIGTACEPEGLWSQADAVLTKRRSSMNPLNFECILYLKYNRSLWGLADVVEANRRRMNDTAANQKRLKENRDRIQAMKDRVEHWDKFQTLLKQIENNINSDSDDEVEIEEE